MLIAVVIPVYGQHHLTETVLADLTAQGPVPGVELAVYLVDNGDDWEGPHPDGTRVVRPGENLGWTRGTNLGLETAAAERDVDVFMCLNNDVRLDPRFVEGLAGALRAYPRAGLLAPLYDDVWAHQKGPYLGPAADYVRPDPPTEREVGFVDGTCMLITHRAWNRLGPFDEEHFGAHGWGADIDYGCRAVAAGLKVLVTDRAYLNHEHQGTAKHMGIDWNAAAEAELQAGMTAKYGPTWREDLTGG